MRNDSLTTAFTRLARPYSRWLQVNLLSTWYNTLITVVVLIGAFLFFKAGANWVFITADWSVVTANIKLFLVGQYPFKELWRVELSILLIAFLFGLGWGTWGGTARTFAVALAILLGALALAPVGLDQMDLPVRLWLLANPAVIVAGYYLSATPLGRPKWILICSLAFFVLGLVLLRGIPGVPGLEQVGTGVWGGLLLNFLIALVGIVASFPLGVALALGRRSGLPVVKASCIAFIETIRGVPLVSLLFMTQIILPLFLPENIQIDRVLRALLAITFFSAAYTAENIRGGLQAIPSGQFEAAKALGLPGRYVMLLIVLPQAIRNVIPAVVGQFISLFKDTSLVVTVGLLDILGIGKSIVLGNVEWIDNQREVYLFLAAVFWVFTYSMAYASRRLEASLGVGER